MQNVSIMKLLNQRSDINNDWYGPQIIQKEYPFLLTKNKTQQSYYDSDPYSKKMDYGVVQDVYSKTIGWDLTPIQV